MERFPGDTGFGGCFRLGPLRRGETLFDFDVDVVATIAVCAAKRSAFARGVAPRLPALALRGLLSELDMKRGVAAGRNATPGSENSLRGRGESTDSD